MAEDQAQSFINQASQSLQSGQLNQALDFADQAIALNPGMVDAYVIRAVSLAQLNQPQEATRAFEDAIRIQPDNAKTRFNLAVHLVRQGQKVEALTQVREAQRLDPNHAGAREMLLQLEGELGVTPTPAPGSEAVPPVAGVASPYGANPYQQQNPYPQGAPSQPYFRPPQKEHNVALVEQIGGGVWTGIGWVFIIAWFLINVIYMVTEGPVFMQTLQDVLAGETPADPDQGSPLWTVLALLFSVSSLAWMIIDIIDRRSSWIWGVFFAICCCCGPVQVLYMLLGRKNSGNA